MISTRTDNARNKRFSSGFSLVELIVVVSIFIIMTTIVLFNQNKFSSDISISNVAHSIALSIREAQVYGILVRESEVNGSDSNFTSAYGIHFLKLNSLDPSFALIFFSDDDDDLRYTDDPADSEINRYTLAEGNRITEICTYGEGSGDVNCTYASGSNEITTADIVFKRPEPRAIITDSNFEDAPQDYLKEIRITITSSLGDKTRIVKVLSSGQVSVMNQTP